jgi:preprotein translocase subunit SecF
MVKFYKEKKITKLINMKQKLHRRKFKGIKHLYEHEYKKLLFIPFIILLLAFIQIGYQIATTGTFVNQGISLKGGVILSVHTDDAIDIKDLENFLGSNLNAAVEVRSFSSAGVFGGVIIESDIDNKDVDSIEKLQDLVEEKLGISLTGSNSSLEVVGSSLGKSFFRDTIMAVILAFFVMGLIVFFFFRSLAPSAAVILAAFSDIVVTIAIINLLEIKLSTAGVAAFLMMIGYSVDTDILLSVRVLKRKKGTLMERIYSAMKTGFIMTLTTLAAISVAFFMSNSEVIKQIMIILLFGLLIDLINTWIQNVGILRMYLEKKGIKK